MIIILVSAFIFIIILPIIHLILEAIILFLSPKLFVSFGIPISSKKLKFDFNILNPNNNYIVKKTVANYLFDSEKIVYIYPKIFWSGFYNVRTRFSLRMYCKIEGNLINVTSKVSAFSVIHLIISVFGLSTLIIWSLLTNQEFYIPVVSGLFLIFTGISIIQPYFALEDNQNSMMNELKKIVTTHNTRSHEKH